MIAAITYENIIRKMRPVLSAQSGVDLNRIINATAVRGPDLFKLISETQATSPNLRDCFIVFELTESNSGENAVTHELDGSVSSISPLDFTLRIYGNLCHEVSQNILMRFRTEEVALDLLEKGIYVKYVSFPSAIHEFINNTLWPRCDMSIHIIVRFNSASVTATPDAEEIGGFIIETTEQAEQRN